MTASVTPFDLAARGFALFPLRPDSKLPAVSRDWEHAATTSPLRLRRLCADPRANYAIACGPSNLIVLDLDVAKEPEGGPRDGWQVLRELADGREIPRTFAVGTPSGGRHLYFRPPVDGPTPRNTVRRLGPLIDTRGVGGYVVAPGSRIGGVPYRVIEDAPIAELPAWISTLLHAAEPRPAADGPLPLAGAIGTLRERLSGAYARSALEREVARVEAARVGTRNDTLNRAAYNLGTLIGVGLLDQAQVEAELTRAALGAGLDARETASTLRSGLTAGIAHPRTLPAGPGGGMASTGLTARRRTDGGDDADAPAAAAGEQLDLLGDAQPTAPPRPPRIGDAFDPGIPMRAAAAARLAQPIAAYDEAARDEESRDGTSRSTAFHDEASRDRNAHDGRSHDEATRDAASRDVSSHREALHEATRDGARHDAATRDAASRDMSPHREALHEASRDGTAHDAATRDAASRDASSHCEALHETSRDGTAHGDAPHDATTRDATSRDGASGQRGGVSRAGAGEPVTVLIPAREPQAAEWPRLFGSHVRLGNVAAALRRELAEAVPRLAMPAMAEPCSAERLREDAAQLLAALARLDEAYDRGACAARPLVTAVRWHLIRTLADLLRDLHDELLDAVFAPVAEPGAVTDAGAARRREPAALYSAAQRDSRGHAARPERPALRPAADPQPLSPHGFALVQALCAATGQRISALAKELSTQLALEGQRRSPLWNAVRRLQRGGEDISVLCLGDRPTRYAAARSALESQLTAMRRESHAA